MGKETWHDVWRNKAEARHSGPGDLTLADLMRMDGYDIACSTVNSNALSSFVEHLARAFLPAGPATLLEVGCGAGAICRIFSDLGVNVTGVDYTEELLAVARRVMPNNVFVHADAVSFDLEKKDYDLVLCHSVCHYFPSEEYMLDAMRLMLQHASNRGVIAITDVHDMEQREEHIRRRRESLGRKVYDELYKDLSHFFYKKSLFIEFAEEYSLNIEIEKQFLPSASGNFKFNVYLSDLA